MDIAHSSRSIEISTEQRTTYMHIGIKKEKVAKCELDSLTKGSVPNARLKVNENLRSRLKNSKFQFAGECTYCV